MKTAQSDRIVEQELVARLDRIPFWPHSNAVLWVVGIGYLIAFFDISNVAFGLPVFAKVLHFAPGQEAMPITASLLGYVIGAYANSNFSDLLGRKPGIITATLLFSGGCIGTTFAYSFDSMVAGRFITGMGIGAEIAVISAYIGEMAPAAVRGRYTSVANLFAMLGQGVVPIVALALVANFSWGWRAMFGIGALGVLTLFAFPYLPESPRWLLNKNRISEAAAIIHDAEARAMRRTGGVLPAPKVATADLRMPGFPTATLLRAPYASRVWLLVALWFVLYTGMYTWLGLGPTFFVARGFTLTHSILFMLASSLGYPLGSLLGAAIGDRFEHKYSIMMAMALWTCCFAAIGVAARPGVIYASVFLLAGSLGFYLPLLYTLTAESFPTQARATGVSLTDGVGHLGGAIGPILALGIHRLGGSSHGFIAVFLFMAASGLITVALLPFTIKATGKSLTVLTIAT